MKLKSQNKTVMFIKDLSKQMDLKAVRSFFLLVLAGLLAVMVTSSARAQYVDEELWLGSGLKQAINKDLSWSLQWENRWTQGMRWHDQGLLTWQSNTNGTSTGA